MPLNIFLFLCNLHLVISIPILVQRVMVEDFLLKVHLLALEYSDNKSPLLQETSKEEILELVSEWYDKKYRNLYEAYHSRGKGFPLHIPSASADCA